MITMNTVQAIPSVEVAMEEWLEEKIGIGVADATLKSYRTQMHSIGKRIDFSMPVDKLNQKVANKLAAMLTHEGISKSTIETYVRMLSVFVSWCRESGYTTEKIKLYRAPEVIKPTYSDEDLEKLLKKPNMNRCTFPEYRTWVIINLMMNNGCRAGTVRGILIKDVNFDQGYILTRHNKNGHIQSMPMSTDLIEILQEYLSIRKGEKDDYLFCNESGERLTETALRSSFRRYNKSRGVHDSSIHEFRHTFAKKYLLECGGDAFTLQKLMGHRTLEMTKHYCNIYDSELARDYDARSPLTMMNKKVAKKTPTTITMKGR